MHSRYISTTSGRGNKSFKRLASVRNQPLEEKEVRKNQPLEEKEVAKSSSAQFVNRSNTQDDHSELRKVSFKDLLLLNKPDWPLVLIGVVASAATGALFPAMSPLFSEILRVSEQVSKYDW